jgi:hypothetical protein
VIDGERDVAGELLQQAHFLLVEETHVGGVQAEDADCRAAHRQGNDGDGVDAAVGHLRLVEPLGILADVVRHLRLHVLHGRAREPETLRIRGG